MRVFLLALATLTSLFLLAGLVAEATQRGLAPSQILTVIPLVIPNTLPYTVPSTTLFADLRRVRPAGSRQRDHRDQVGRACISAGS